MADFINQPKDVREAQEYLRRIAFAYTRIPIIAVDGIYGPETTNAVRTFQMLFGLPVTGDIDPYTWDELSRIYQVLTLQDTYPNPLFHFQGDVRLHPGDIGENVFILQIMLNTLSRYENIPPVTLNGQYDEQTTVAVRAAQQAYALEPTGVVDRRTWDLIARSYNDYVGR